MIPARIIKLEEFPSNRGYGTIVCASGGFDPLHPGHASYLVAATNLGDMLVVLVNGDKFLERKKGRPFMPVQDRCDIVATIRGVDLVIPFDRSDPEDDTVSEALLRIKPDIFAKGGDRVDEKTIPEWGTCKATGIKVETGVGRDKEWSSSEYLAEWEKLSRARAVEDAATRLKAAREKLGYEITKQLAELDHKVAGILAMAREGR